MAEFIQDFSSSTGFTYDPTKAEFVGGVVRQVANLPAGATLYASYTSSIDANWGGGTLTGTATGGAAVSGGQLDLDGENLKYVTYSAVNNADSLQVGCVRFKITPNWSGNPTTNKVFFCVRQSSGNPSYNLVGVRQMSTGWTYVDIYNNVGAVIWIGAVGKWVPVAGVEYEFELNFDITTGATRLFIDGTQFGSTITATGTRSGAVNDLLIGTDRTAAYLSDFKINDFLVFDSVQHTTNYTPDWSGIPESAYQASTVTLPEMEHTDPGTIQTITDFTTVESGSPRYTVQIGQSGDYLYWTGSAWAVSSGTYAQATDAATFNSNASTLPVASNTYLQFKINFDDSGTQAEVDTLTATYAVEVPAQPADVTAEPAKITMIGPQSANTYDRLLAMHMPIGRVWERCFDPNSNIGKFVAGLAVEYYRLSVLTYDIVLEMDIDKTLALLDEWEKSVGIPNNCFTTATTTEDRRIQIESIFSNFGGVQTLADFERIAALFGFTVDIQLGAEIGEFPLHFPITFFESTQASRFTLIVRASLGSGDEFFALPFPMPFSAGGTTFLKCIFELVAPANVAIVFTQNDFSQP